MKIIVFCLLLTPLIFFSGCTQDKKSLIINANIVTEEGQILYNRAILVKNQIIEEVGTSNELIKKHRDANIIDIKHRWLYPGFIDAHLHILSTGRWLSQPDLSKSTSVYQIQQILKSHIKANPDLSWIVGRGWDQNNWDIKKFPTKYDLDDVEDSKPIVLYRVDGHAVWVNSRTLELAGIDKNTPNPEGGKILRLDNGEPSGVLVDKAIDLISKAMPKESIETKEKYIKKALKYFTSVGLTEIHDAYTDISLIPLFKKLENQKELPLRVYSMVGDESNTENLINFMRKNKPVIPDKTGYLTIRTVKTFADGALGSRGALLFKPYEDDRESIGLSLISREELTEVCKTAKETGYQVATHAIGDSACYLVLKTFLESAGENIKKLRWRVEHAQILSPDEKKFQVDNKIEYLSALEVFGKYGIIPSMQPVHCISDMPWVETRIGKERARYAYAWNTLITNGAVIPAGTDCPVEIADPILNFYSAVTRKDTAGLPESGWYPEEKVDRITAIKMLTVWPAFASFKENYKGKIKPGYLADFTILDRNLLSIPEEEILQTKVLMTIVGGNVMYTSDDY